MLKDAKLVREYIFYGRNENLLSQNKHRLQQTYVLADVITTVTYRIHDISTLFFKPADQWVKRSFGEIFPFTN
jgi:hypothetical protein